MVTSLYNGKPFYSQSNYGHEAVPVTILIKARKQYFQLRSTIDFFYFTK